MRVGAISHSICEQVSSWKMLIIWTETWHIQLDGTPSVLDKVTKRKISLFQVPSLDFTLIVLYKVICSFLEILF